MSIDDWLKTKKDKIETAEYKAEVREIVLTLAPNGFRREVQHRLRMGTSNNTVLTR